MGGCGWGHEGRVGLAVGVGVLRAKKELLGGEPCGRRRDGRYLHRSLVLFIFCLHFFWYRIQYIYGEGSGNPLQYSCLENPMYEGAWWAAVHGVARGRTRLSNFAFTFHLHALEKEMATHSSILAWRIPGVGKPGGLPSMGSHRVGHD